MNRPARSPHNCTRFHVASRAYTLIELIMVVAILGLAGALLVPRLIDQDSFAIQAAVRNIVADLTFAQSDALANQEFRRVHFYDDGSGYCIYRVDEATFASPFDAVTADYISDPMAGSGEQHAYIVDFSNDDVYDGVTIEAAQIDNGVRHITYDRLGGTVMTGGLPGTGGDITVRSANFTYQITINAFTGKLSVQRVDG